MQQPKITKADELKFKNLVEKRLVPSYQRTLDAGLKLTPSQQKVMEKASRSKAKNITKQRTVK